MEAIESNSQAICLLKAQLAQLQGKSVPDEKNTPHFVKTLSLSDEKAEFKRQRARQILSLESHSSDTDGLVMTSFAQLDSTMQSVKELIASMDDLEFNSRKSFHRYQASTRIEAEEQLEMPLAMEEMMEDNNEVPPIDLAPVSMEDLDVKTAKIRASLEEPIAISFDNQPIPTHVPQIGHKAVMEMRRTNDYFLRRARVLLQASDRDTVYIPRSQQPQQLKLLALEDTLRQQQKEEMRLAKLLEQASLQIASVKRNADCSEEERP